MMRKLKARGMDALDARTKAVKDVLRTKEAIIAELGGDEHLTEQKRILVDAIARELVFLNQIDSYVMAQDSILLGRGKQKRLLPVLRERNDIVKRLTNLLGMIGLERQARPIVDAIRLVKSGTEHA